MLNATRSKIQGLERSEEDNVVFRPEEFEDAILQTRKAIGNLKDTKPGMFVAMDAMMSLGKRGVDAKKIARAYLAISESGKYQVMDDEAIKELIAMSDEEPLDVL